MVYRPDTIKNKNIIKYPCPTTIQKKKKKKGYQSNIGPYVIYYITPISKIVNVNGIQQCEWKNHKYTTSVQIWLPHQSLLCPLWGQIPGMDSSYYIWTNVSVRRYIIWGISVRNVHRERYCFSLVCSFKKVIKNFEVKVGVQGGP